MTENKTGDFAQNLPESRPEKTQTQVPRQLFESAFKSTIPKIGAPVDPAQKLEQTIPASVSQFE